MNNYTQLCVMHDTTLGDYTPAYFEEFIKNQLDSRAKFEAEIVTDAGRHDLLFYIHGDDISKFAVKRFEFGIRWWEDVIKYNDGAGDYSEEILNKYPATW